MRIQQIVFAIFAAACAGTAFAQATTAPGQPPADPPSTAQPPSITAPSPAPPAAPPAASQPSTEPAPTSSVTIHLEQQIVRQAQQALQQKGLYNGPIDGIVSPSTDEAVRAFQQQQGLPRVTGELDDQTVAALGISPGAARSTAPSTPSSSRAPSASATPGRAQ